MSSTVEETVTEFEALPVRVVGSEEVEGTDFSTWNTYTLTGVLSSDTQRILPLDRRRKRAAVIVMPGANVAVNQIPLGATGVASYNNNAFGVNQTITGGTVTAIAINGVTTGLTSGVFYVPAGGTVTVTYSVAPTTFTTAAAVPIGNTVGYVLIGSRSQVMNGQGAQIQNGFGTVTEGTQETWMTSDGSHSLSVVVLQERYAGDRV
jgi:hypothetical protein